VKNEISKRKLKVILKDIDESRAESKKRIIQFRNELDDKLKQQRVYLEELNQITGKIDNLRHLIEMYRVMDEHRLLNQWQLETAMGITKLKYPDWKFEFDKKQNKKSEQ